MSDVNRRDVVKVLGLVPLAGALGACTSPAADRAARVAAGEGGRDGLAFFSAPEDATVRVLVDYIIPRDARSGSATDARVPEFMDAFLAHADTPDADRLAVRGGLAWLDAECRRRHGSTFVDADDAARRALLDDIAWPAKARPEMSHGVAFFTRFRDLTASGFFSSEVGYRDLAYQGNVAVPEWRGCPAPAVQRLGVSEAVMATRIPPRQSGRLGGG